ncbi:MAG: phytanoyl-CoA dioxygenase family protein [Sphingomonadaceae bacterium]
MTIDIEAYARDGYAIVRGVLTADEVAAIGIAVDSIHAEALAHGRSFRHGNLFYKVDTSGFAPIVRMAQWPSWQSPALDAVRRDPRFHALLAPLIGDDLKQIINQLHWKAHGSGGDFAWHQDSRFRRPPQAYRDLANAYIQTGLAIDPHTVDAGCMRVVRGSHRRGDLALDTDAQVLGTAMNDTALAGNALDTADIVDLVLAPGDLAIWHPHLVHGSGANYAGHARRFYINGYVRAADCDRGEWTFRGSVPVPLGPEPALVHYEQLHERPEPHFP